MTGLSVALVCYGCSTSTIVQNGYANRKMIAENVKQPSLVSSARNTYLLQSGRVFYPNGQPISFDVLPDLSDTEIQLLRDIAQQELQRIPVAQLRHAAMLANEFGDHNASRVPISLNLTASGLARAGSDTSTGRIDVDAKVIQAIYRAAVISVFSDEGSQSVSLEERQTRAFSQFRNYRARLDSLSSSLATTDIKTFRRGMSNSTQESRMDRALEGAMELLASRLQQAQTVSESKHLERIFIDAIRFLLAHEAGHIALNHPVDPASCADAVRNELAADRYAVLLSSLAIYPSVPPIILAKGASPFSVEFRSPLEDLSQRRDGAQEFFSFAYQLAGFDLRLGNLTECEYPKPETRSAEVNAFGYVLSKTHDEARYDEAYRRFGNREARELFVGSMPFDSFFKSLPERAELDKVALQSDLERQRQLLSQIFYETFGKTR